VVIRRCPHCEVGLEGAVANLSVKEEEAPVASTLSDKEKKLRKLNKVLREVDTLKAKVDSVPLTRWP
jgi:hypothetical protein